jgi:hypothetical protein
MTSQEQYKKDGNSDDLSKMFHDRARDTANDLNKQLLNLSTGIIAGIMVLAFNKRDILNCLECKLILITIVLFGCSIFSIILGMQWDASKSYYLGHINDSTRQQERTINENFKRNFDKKQKKAKQSARYFFLLGILSSVIFLSIFLLQHKK